MTSRAVAKRALTHSTHTSCRDVSARAERAPTSRAARSARTPPERRGPCTARRAAAPVQGPVPGRGGQCDVVASIRAAITLIVSALKSRPPTDRSCRVGVGW